MKAFKISKPLLGLVVVFLGSLTVKAEMSCRGRYSDSIHSYDLGPVPFETKIQVPGKDRTIFLQKVGNSLIVSLTKGLDLIGRASVQANGVYYDDTILSLQVPVDNRLEGVQIVCDQLK